MSAGVMSQSEISSDHISILKEKSKAGWTLLLHYESEFTKEVQNMKKIRGLRSSGRAGTAAARAAPELVEPILE